VTAERPIEPDPQDVVNGGGMQGRQVTLRTEQTLWSAKMAPPLPEEIEMNVLGWTIEDGGVRRPALTVDSPRVAVGDRYLVPLAQVTAGTGALEWWPLSLGAQLPIVDERIEMPEEVAWTSPILEKLAGTSVGEVDTVLDQRPPDPLAQKYEHLRPQERIAAVTRERAAIEGVPPAEPSR
jgi:hypothetical protein